MGHTPVDNASRSNGDRQHHTHNPHHQRNGAGGSGGGGGGGGNHHDNGIGMGFHGTGPPPPAAAAAQSGVQGASGQSNAHAMLTILQNIASHQQQQSGGGDGGGVGKVMGQPRMGPAVAAGMQSGMTRGALRPPPPMPPALPTTIMAVKRPASQCHTPPAQVPKQMGIVDLNVGGTIFTVGMATLLSDPQSLFHSIYSTLPSTLVRGGGKTGGAGKQVSPPSSTHLPAGMEFDDSGRVFFDRSPENFPQILTYLRDETLPREECALHVYHEAKFYRVQGLMDWCSRQAGVVGMLINRLVHESMEEECEQFKQAILQASHHHISESLKVNFTDSRASIVCYDLPATTTAMPTALPMTTSGAMSSSSTTTPTTTRSLQTTLLLVVSQHQQGNICPKRPNAVPVPPPILTPVDGNAPAPPRFQSARFVVGDPQLSSHRFISNAASLTSARHRIDIALPFMLGKRLDLLYTFVARHFSAADMRLTLRQGSTSGPPLSLQVSAAPSPTVISNQPISGVQSSGTSAREIPCFECGQPFSLYEMVVTWWTA